MSNERFSRPVPDFFLGKQAANKHIGDYQSGRYITMSEQLGKPDTRSLWYSFRQIELLYQEMVYLNADGLRIYFGQYDNSVPELQNQLCLVMVPTRANDTSEGHADILLEDEDDFALREGSGAFLELSRPGWSKAYNYGSPCPPVCPVEDELKYPFPEIE